MVKRNAIGTTFGGTSEAFKDRCFTFLDILCNEKDMEAAATYLAPDCILIHEDHSPVKGPKAFIDVWKSNLVKMPDYHKDIEDLVVEMESGSAGVARVWVYSRIKGIAKDAVTESVDMMRFTANGLFLESKDVQRTTKDA